MGKHIKLSDTQRYRLRRLEIGGWYGSNTNPTMRVLEKHGFVLFTSGALVRFSGVWTITDAGREYLKGNDQ